MPLSNVDDDEEIWVGARVRLYNVGMNRENNFYEYIISYIYDNTNYLQLTNLTTGKAGYIICVIEKELPNNYALGRTLKQRIGLENTYFRFE
ncbi:MULTISPECIES: hypothetical protein [Bacillus]|uniref:Uncharacterized protein n=1 Tax=Bacillus cereus TaxID=1396 RepID=A0A9X9A3S6_BACCE|nr:MULTISPECIES: hypothetical protein [Bacillus cereus group]MCM3220578.1 hypothetical protein [Bacillus cereus]MCU4930010.1 hypothetical protein [Bacillus cereus]OBW50827.1 hypothetical protein A9987_14065 [Bacillus cereus]OFC76377.1 hypothetical protein BTGOE1_33410 [Bacillus thuringiensis]OFC80688.1 hypothetical protein BTGOE2_34330 [Bacillus thuringiensis]